jgi:hypothetical protein
MRKPMARERILRPTLIPSSLWDAQEETLFVPRPLAQAYADLIDSEGLRYLAEARETSSSPVGGLTKEATDAHLAQAFDGSVARALLAVLDPKSEASSTSNTFVRVTAGNSACITDAPCGAGAATLAFLCALAELREARVLPRLPLKVMIIGGEISEPAAAYAKHLLDAVKPTLLTQAIFIEHTITHWDVTCPISTTDLIKCALQNNQESASKLLVVANFNSFLESNGKRKDAMPQLEELFRYASGDNSFAVWIEPKMNKVLSPGGLFEFISSFFSTFWKSRVSKESNALEDQAVFTSEASFERPLFRPKKGKVRLAVMPINLQRASR